MRQLISSVLLAALLNAPALAAVPAAGTEPPGADAPPRPRTIVLVRHGHYAADDTIPEDSGPPLSPLGLAQARLAGAALEALPAFDARVSSPMQRARDTAAAIALEMHGPAFSVEDDLAECLPPTRRREITAGEDPADLAACAAKLDGVFARHFVPAQGDGDDALLLVCHGNVIRWLVTRALGVDPAAWLEMSVRHASLTTITVEADGRFKVIAVGDAGHLPPGLRTGATGDPDRTLALPVVTP